MIAAHLYRRIIGCMDKDKFQDKLSTLPAFTPLAGPEATTISTEQRQALAAEVLETDLTDNFKAGVVLALLHVNDQQKNKLAHLGPTQATTPLHEYLRPELHPIQRAYQIGRTLDCISHSIRKRRSTPVLLVRTPSGATKNRKPPETYYYAVQPDGFTIDLPKSGENKIPTVTLMGTSALRGMFGRRFIAEPNAEPRILPIPRLEQLLGYKTHSTPQQLYLGRDAIQGARLIAQAQDDYREQVAKRRQSDSLD
jgi:hypothetical protein